MSIRIQRFDEHLKMPWKNGLGITREVISRPASDGSGVFDWRISLATVGVSGPFSIFAGIDRTIAVLKGDGMQLTVDGGREPPLLVDSPPFAFSGNARSLILAESGEVDAAGILRLRLMLLVSRSQFLEQVS